VRTAVPASSPRSVTGSTTSVLITTSLLLARQCPVPGRLSRSKLGPSLGPTARPDLLKITLGSAAPCPNPQMLLVLARDLLVDRDPDHAKTAAQGRVAPPPGQRLGPAVKWWLNRPGGACGRHLARSTRPRVA
jgi:hypothetical protein